jgi:hypothetical protein
LIGCLGVDKHKGLETRGANVFELIIKKNYQMSSFGGAYEKTTSDYVIAAKDAIDTMNANLPKITIKDEEDEFRLCKFREEYEKIYRDAVEYTDPIVKAINGLPVYYRYHIKNGLALGKGLKMIRYKDFTIKRNQSQKKKKAMRVRLIRNAV